MTKDKIKPQYYKAKNGFEVFEVMEGYVGDLKGMDAFYWCNVIKYILRFQNKNGLEDLLKARHYLEKLIISIAKDNFSRGKEI